MYAVNTVLVFVVFYPNIKQRILSMEHACVIEDYIIFISYFKNFSLRGYYRLFSFSPTKAKPAKKIQLYLNSNCITILHLKYTQNSSSYSFFTEIFLMHKIFHVRYIIQSLYIIFLIQNDAYFIKSFSFPYLGQFKSICSGYFIHIYISQLLFLHYISVILSLYYYTVT